MKRDDTLNHSVKLCNSLSDVRADSRQRDLRALEFCNHRRNAYILALLGVSRMNVNGMCAHRLSGAESTCWCA